MLGNILMVAGFLGSTIFGQSNRNKQSDVLREERSALDQEYTLQQNKVIKQNNQILGQVSNTSSMGNTYGGLGSNQLQRQETNDTTDNQLKYLKTDLQHKQDAIDTQISQNNNYWIENSAQALMTVFSKNYDSFSFGTKNNNRLIPRFKPKV